MVAVAEKPADSSHASIGPIAGQWPDEQFLTVRNVPIFAEHDTETKAGRTLNFGKRELQAVADRCNQRISETGDYAVVCIGHTPDAEQKTFGHPVDPEVVGFAGPFRVGVIGRAENQRFAILADMHYFRDSAVLKRVRSHPRRSPELWKSNGDYEEMYLDPICLLGAETPRLDMGLFYTAVTKDGQHVEKYAAAACPSASNTFIRGETAGRDKENYENTETPSMSPEDVKQIVDAISQLDWVQWVKSQMEAEIGSNSTIDSAPLTPSVDAAVPAGNLDTELSAGVPSTNGEPDGNELPVPPDYGDEESDDDDAAVEKFRKWRKKRWGARKYGAAEGQTETEPTKPEATMPVAEKKTEETTSPSKYQRPEQPERYAKLEAQVVQLRGQIEKHQRELETERATRIDAERYGQLSALRQRFIFDMDREFDRVKYGKMSEQQFAEFAGPGGMIESNFQPIPIGETLPTFDGHVTADRGPEKYSNAQRDAQRDQALRYCETRSLAGEKVDYKTTLDRIAAGEKLE